MSPLEQEMLWMGVTLLVWGVVLTVIVWIHRR